MTKCTNDYGHKNFPSASHILDFLRFSVTFGDIKSLLDGLNTFINDIEKGTLSCLKPNGIVRIKNGFANIANWHDCSSAEYCDIKLNIIFCPENVPPASAMIIEAQFFMVCC